MLYEDLLELGELFENVRTRNATEADLQRDHSLYTYDAKKKTFILKEEKKTKETSKNKKEASKNEASSSSSSTAINGKASTTSNTSKKQKEKEKVESIVKEDDNTSPTFGKNKTVGIREMLGSTGNSCTICLCEYEDKDEIRVLHCKHAFHKQCIDEWISKYVNNCPICRG
ncbi:hypothetical protein BCR36DRAFT_249279, partial [Piromyces finnis]